MTRLEGEDWLHYSARVRREGGQLTPEEREWYEIEQIRTDLLLEMLDSTGPGRITMTLNQERIDGDLEAIRVKLQRIKDGTFPDRQPIQPTAEPDPMRRPKSR
jgi:hypothetical protein